MKRAGILLSMVIVCALVAAQAPARSFFKIGEPAPNFTLTSVTDERLTMGSLRGKVVVLGLFHICEPCLLQGSNLQKV